MGEVSIRWFSAGYQSGRGYGEVAADLEKALNYFTQAIELGSIQSMRTLGQLYYNGRDHIPADVAKAVRYFEMAAERGCGQSMHMLGGLHHTDNLYIC